MSAPFVHLHIHSEFSLVDSTLRVPALIAGCVADAAPAAALTDQSNLFAWVKFYEAAEAAGIKPVCGCDLWIATSDEPDPWRLTLLCQNHDGYLNLSRLISRAWAEGQSGGRTVVDATWLDAQTSAGLIALFGRESLAGQHGVRRASAATHAALEPWLRLFPERLYLELTRTSRDGEDAWNETALNVAGAASLPVVASNDVRFLKREDFEAHEARVCIHDGRVLADPRRPHRYSPEQYLKSPQQMAELFADIPEALENTLELAQRCNVEMSFGTYYLPQFPVPAGHDLDSYIRERATAGLEERLARFDPAPGHERRDYDERLEHELGVILQMGFPGYFLIVSDFISWAKQHDIPVGPGRGSGAGSLVAWALKITDLDPLRFNLLFERFLNPERVSMPDFDVDFCMDKRDQVIDYVARKYGRDHVSQIVTFGSMAAKAVLRDCGRVLGMPYGQVDRVAKLIPARPLDLTLSDALGRSSKAKADPERVVKDFCAVYADDPEAKPLIDLALKLEGLSRNTGKHAGGVVIGPRPLTEFSPLACEPDGSGVITQFDKHDVESVGLVKFDFLGLRTLTIIDWAVKAINLRRAAGGEDALDIARIALDDAEVFRMFREARTIAVFQFEGGGMQRLLKDAKPDRFEDLIALNSLFRPGPMDLIPTYVARKLGREPVAYPDPRVEPILKETFGIMVYQEQVMQMAQILGGYTLGGADLLRRAMGKKKLSEMVKQRATFAAGAAQHGLSAEQANAIFDLMEKFAGYGFNKSHATAYSLVAYQTAWLKVHYPAEFMAATLSSDMDNTDKVVMFLHEITALGLKVLLPDVNASAWMFEAVDDGTAVRYGLGAIKGVGRGVSEAIAAECAAHGPYRDLIDFCTRVSASGLNKRVFEALIQAGAMDALGANRASLMAQVGDAIKVAEQRQRDATAGQNDMFRMGGDAPQAKSIVLPTVADWSLDQRLAGEYQTLGHYLSGHPTQPWHELLLQLSTCPFGEVDERYQASHAPIPDGEGNHRRHSDPLWTAAGLITSVRRRGDDTVFITLEDETGHVHGAFYGDACNQYLPLLTTGAMLVIDGPLSIDRFLGGYRIRVRHASTLDEVCEQRGQSLQLELDGVTKAFPDQLRQTLNAYLGGPTALYLAGYHNAAGRADLQLGEAWRVRARPALLTALRTLPGVRDAQLRLARPA